MSKDTCVTNILDQLRSEGVEFDEARIQESVTRYRTAQSKGANLLQEKQTAMKVATEFADDQKLKKLEFQIKQNELKQRAEIFFATGQEDKFSSATASNSYTNIAGGKASFENRMRSMNGRMEGEWKTLVGDKYGKSLRNRAFQDKVIDAMYEIKTKGKAVSKFNADVIEAAEGIVQYNDKILRIANEKGIQIKKRADYIFTEVHDPTKMALHRADTWADDVMKDGVIDWDTSLEGVPLEKRKNILIQMHHDMISGAYSEGGASTRLGSRELNFKSSQALREYNAKYGNNDLNSAMEGSRRGLAKKMAMYQTWGNDPVRMFDEMEGWLGKKLESEGDPKRLEKFRSHSARRKNTLKKELFGYGPNSAAGGIEATAVKVINGAKTISALSKLIGSAFSTFTDLGIGSSNIAVKTGRNVSEIWGRYSKSYFKNLDIGKKRRIGRLLELDVQSSIQARMDIEGSAQKVGTIQDILGKWNGLEAATNQNRSTAAMVFSDVLAEEAKIPFKDLNPNIKKELRAFEIDEAEWEFLRTHGIQEVEGMTLMTPNALREKDFGKMGLDVQLARSSADKLSMMINHEAFNMGAPQADINTKAMIRFGINPNTAAGAGLSAILQFKSYGFRILDVMREITTHADGGQGILDGLGKGKGNLRAFGHLMGSTFVLSSFGLMARDLAMGKEPRNPSDPKNILDAFVRGVMPVQFDPLMSTLSGEYSKGGFRSFTKDLAGPVLGSLGDIAQVVSMSLDDEVKGKTVAKRALSTLKYNLPRVNPLVAVALDKAFFEGLEERLDPRSYQRRVKREKERAKISDIWE